MRVILTENPLDLGERPIASHEDCACDCQCACPTDGTPTPALSTPVAYYLELTPACNNRCPGCGNVYAEDRVSSLASTKGIGKSPSSPLNGDEWRDLIARLAPHTHHLKLTGGEATLHPAFAEIVRAVQEHGIPFTLFTNGRWSRPDQLINQLPDSTTFEGFLVSLHGPDAPTHEAFSGVPGSFNETAANIRRAADAGLDVATSVVLNRHNWNRVQETLDRALSLGAKHVVCNRFIGAPSAEIAPSPSQLRTAMGTIESSRAAGRPIRFGNCVPQCFAPSSSRGCTAGSTFATVDPWGRMRPCNHTDLIAGDLRAQSIEEAWGSPIMNDWRAMVPANCATCAVFAECHGGCRAQALLDGLDQDPLIQVPLTETPPSFAPELRLYAGLRPIGRYIHRPERDIDVLLFKSQVVTVPGEYDRLVCKLDGSLTLRQIEHQYGDTAVDWMGALFQDGMVIWSTL